jgi:uncharacterized protein YoxC
MSENTNIYFILEKILAKVEPEKRSVALPLILDALRKKQQNYKNNEKGGYDETDSNVISQDNLVNDKIVLTEQDIINEKVKEEQQLENSDSKIGNDNEAFIEEDIKYSLTYHDNIVEKGEEKTPCQVAEINAIVEKNDDLEEKNATISEDVKDKSPIIRPSVLSCKVNAYNVTSLQNCISEDIEDPVTMETTKEPAMINAPVVLSKVNMEVFIEAITRFPEPVFSIEDLDKNMTLTSCVLIPKSKKLFLEGFIEKRIEYSNAIDITKKEINGDIKNLTVKIPFKCSTEVTFARKPHNTNHLATQRIEIFHFQHKSTSGNKIEERSSIATQELENQVYCKLENVEISEKSKKLGIVKLENTLPNAFTFKKVKEKTVVGFTLSLLQNQDVFIANKDQIHEKDCEDGTKDLETSANADK